MKHFTLVLFSSLLFVATSKYFFPSVHSELSLQYSSNTKRDIKSLLKEQISAYNKRSERVLKQENTHYHQINSSGSNKTHYAVLSGKNYRLNSQRDNQESNRLPGDSDPSYTLAKAAVTSAGVFNGDVLMRTLWNNEKRSAGTYDLSTAWDGKDDNGNNVPDKNYTIKVVSNNVTYEWLRPIGNTSSSASGSTIHHAGQMITNMVQVGSRMYLARGYNEGQDVHSRFTIGSPNILTTSLKGTGQTTRFLATDGNIVYCAGQKDGSTTYITGITANPNGTDALASFSSGKNVPTWGFTYSGFNITGNNNYITGLAVQQTGDYLFASHATLNELRVFNKKTGASVRTNSLLGVRHLARQNDNEIWLSKITPHSGATTVSKLKGTSISSVYQNDSPPANAFDGNSTTTFRSTGGPINYIGLEFPTLQVITQIRVKVQAGAKISAKLVGDTGWEKVEIGTVTTSSGGFITIPITNTNPFKQVKIDWPDGNALVIDEMEVYGYSHSGVPVVAKHRINQDGTLGAPILTLSGIAEPLAIAVASDGSKVAVADRGTYHQVKLFDTATGLLLQTIGRAENYTNPRVYDDKFYFNNTRIFYEYDYGTAHAFVQFQSDGTLWIGDYGNMRCQHFAQNGAYIDNIQYMGYSYSCQADINNSTRVFSDFLEFSVNYNDNSWRFVRNWSKNITIPTVFDADRMRSVTTLSNGRTYAFYKIDGGRPREVIELDIDTGIRHTGIYMNNYNCELQTDGSIWQMGTGTIGQPTAYQRKPLTGFDGNKNPIWGGYATVETIPEVANYDPITADGYLKRQHQSSRGIIVTFNADNGQQERARGYHLGGFKNGQWVFKASPSTSRDYYVGEFPADGAFDIGNGVNSAGTFMQVVDRNIFWGYNGEFWQASQTNKYNHYLDNGLMIGQFGITGPETSGEAAPMMAGNALSGTYVKVGNDIHFFHCDEGHHGAVHHWKISNLSSIQETSILVTKASITNIPALDYVDLMEGIPRSGMIASGTGRWTYSPTAYYKANFDRWQVKSGTTTYKRNERSLRFTSYPTANGLSQEAYCDLSVKPGAVNSCTSWLISGRLVYPEISESYDNFIDVVDNVGKVIVRISRPDTYPNSSVKANGTTIVSGVLDGLMKKLFGNAQDISIRRSGSRLLVSYAGYPEVSVAVFDQSANLDSPTKLHVHFYSVDNRGHQIDLANLKFYPASTVVAEIGTGLTGQYFNNNVLSDPLVAVRTDSMVNFSWGLASPLPGQVNADNFSTRWSGQVQAPVSGTYIFSTAGDDGMRLWINGEQVINNWAYHATIDNTAPITLIAGQKYDIKLEYYDRGQAASIQLMWAYPGQVRQAIPKQWLYPSLIKSPNGRVGSNSEEIVGESVYTNKTNFISAYPVPAQDFLWVKYYAKEAGDVSVRLVSVSAQTVFQLVHTVIQGENTLKIPVKGFAHGVYLLNIIQGHKGVSQRVILSD